MRHRQLLVAALALVGLGACDMGRFTVNTTAKVLARAQPSLQQEADWQLAHDAIPGALKTIEGFWVVDEDSEILIPILTEGYCQYGTAFVEDDWEVSTFDKKMDDVAYHNGRATHVFSRCLNFALKSLGERWQKEIFADPATVAKLVKESGGDQRDAMMWAGVALGSVINHNLNRAEMIGYLSTVQAILNRVVEIDATRKPKNESYAALPHVALGMVNSAVGAGVGGKPEVAKKEFETALAITNNRFLLARAMMAFRVGKQTNDRKFFHDQLKMVLETPPSVWPEQRLANEVAHRRARRYLSHEKEIF